MSLNGFIIKKDEIEFKYSNNAIDRASENGHFNVIEWFYNKKNEI